MYSVIAVVEKAGGRDARGEVIDSVARGNVTRLRISWG
jgi:hypothetical protein